MDASDVVMIGTNAVSEPAPRAFGERVLLIVLAIGSRVSRLLPHHGDTKNEIPVAGCAHQTTRLP